MKTNARELLARLPGPVSPKWPHGERFIKAFSHKDMLTELYAPCAIDPQTPHDRDELYFIIAGNGDFVCGNARQPFAAGDALFVPAHMPHRFEKFSDDFMTWVVFFGPTHG
jgi:mannose-6-phosphate isomerase-like protein (cupin superfamily)